ncbi:hypothetical protein DPMN_038259 [Dreissena polymorpha]|uniref:Uncharacterized protein n=1 Tax=Dreissena polymorpha TaxID=45954 RepID=A0A9D4MEX3_DREPO|nr:hypothetical protein DPMN_038259 [Dreissena polymorpha]
MMMMMMMSCSESKFYCWAGWQEKTYTFLVVGDKSGLPQYCLVSNTVVQFLE